MELRNGQWSYHYKPTKNNWINIYAKVSNCKYRYQVQVSDGGTQLQKFKYFRYPEVAAPVHHITQYL